MKKSRGQIYLTLKIPQYYRGTDYVACSKLINFQKFSIARFGCFQLFCCSCCSRVACSQLSNLILVTKVIIDSTRGTEKGISQAVSALLFTNPTLPVAMAEKMVLSSQSTMEEVYIYFMSSEDTSTIT